MEPCKQADKVIAWGAQGWFGTAEHTEGGSGITSTSYHYL